MWANCLVSNASLNVFSEDVSVNFEFGVKGCRGEVDDVAEPDGERARAFLDSAEGRRVPRLPSLRQRPRRDTSGVLDG